MANPTIRDRRGRKIRLTDIPMTVFATKCGHGGKDHGVLKGDLVFCEPCGDRVRVTAILASRGEMPAMRS